MQIADPNGHLCHIRCTVRDIISGQAETRIVYEDISFECDEGDGESVWVE